MAARAFLLGLVFLAACEPSRRNRAEMYVRDLQDVHEWHPTRQARGHFAYDGLLGLAEESVPVLIDHLTDDRPTKIMDLADITVPTVGDVCFHILSRLFSLRPADFRREGVTVLEGVPNPLFAVRFDPGARARVQRRFREMAEKRE